MPVVIDCIPVRMLRQNKGLRSRPSRVNAVAAVHLQAARAVIRLSPAPVGGHGDLMGPTGYQESAVGICIMHTGHPWCWGAKVTGKL